MCSEYSQNPQLVDPRLYSQHHGSGTKGFLSIFYNHGVKGYTLVVTITFLDETFLQVQDMLNSDLETLIFVLGPCICNVY